VLDGKARSRCPRADPQLMEDGVEVPADGAGAKEEPVGNLGAGEYFRKVLSCLMYTKPQVLPFVHKTPVL
jgi:hypothetical protein